MHNPSPIPYHLLEQVRSMAFIDPSIEACGYIFDDETVTQVENTASKPKEAFRIAAQDHLNALRSGKQILAIWHTHLQNTRLSGADINASTQLKIPYLVFCLANSRWDYYDPGYIPPLIGRQWRHPYTNCGTLVRDWFRQQYGFDLPFIELDESRLNDPTYSPVLDNADSLGFAVLPFVLGDLRESDIIVFTLGTNHPMHCGVITDLSSNQFLHHPIHQLSRYDVLGNYWLKYATKILRWKEWT